MSKGDFLGEFEQRVLLALLRLGDNAYGMTVRQELEERAKRAVSIGAVYTTLERMEQKGYVSSRVADPTPERGGRAKRFFKIEGEGRAARKRSQEALAILTRGLPGFQGR